MARVLVIYQSKYGQTEKIASFIAGQLKSAGFMTDMLNVQRPRTVSLNDYDGFILGGALYSRRFPKKLSKWISENVDGLNKRPSAFFAVCLAVMQKEPKVREDLEHILGKFLRQNNWSPDRHRVFAGALSYTKYGWVMKQVMKLISRSSHGATDTSRDQEYTDWSEVSQFVKDFVRILPSAPPPKSEYVEL